MESCIKKVEHRRTICEVLREIHDLCQDDSDKAKIIRGKLLEAIHMAKRMNLKLLEYKKDYDADWWEENQDYIKKMLLRLHHDYKTEEQI